MERRDSPSISPLRSRLTQALVTEPATTVSAAQERILEQGFFAPPVTPAPARVISLPPRPPATRP